MRSVYKTLLFAGLASVAFGAVIAGSAARAEGLAPPQAGTLNAQYASLGGKLAPAPEPVVAAAPQAAPSVALATRLVEAAGAYAVYMRQAAAVSPGFQSPNHVLAGLAAGAAYEPGQLEAGATAYAALVALQDPAFVEGVRTWAQQSAGEAPPVERLYADPSQALAAPGARGAVILASAALRAQGQAVLSNGKAVKQAAYSIQHQDWSKARVPDAQARLAGIKAQSAVLFRPSEQEVSALVRSAVAFRREVADAPPPAGVTPTVTRALALAALAVLGGAEEENAERLTPLLSDANTTDCVKMSKLNLYQCMAVAGPEYEDVFCLGQHALIDTGQCMIKAAGLPAAPVLPIAPIQIAQAQSTQAPEPPSAPPSRSILVPVAFAAASPAGR